MDETEYVEDISIINEGIDEVVHLPIKLFSWLHGLEIIDNDDSRISYYSKRQIGEHFRSCKSFLDHQESIYQSNVESDTKKLNLIDAVSTILNSKQSDEIKDADKLKELVNLEQREKYVNRINEKKSVLTDFESIRNQITALEKHQEDFYLLWLRLPDDRPIKTNEMRNIRLRYFIKNDGIPISGAKVISKLRRSFSNIKKSFNYAKKSIRNNHSYLYDVKIYYHEISKIDEEHETEYIINAPKNCTLNIKRVIGEKIKSDTDTTIKDIPIIYRKKMSTTKKEHSSGKVSIRAYDRYIFIRLPPFMNKSTPYVFTIEYTVDLSRLDKVLMYISIPITVFILLELILYPYTFPNVFNYLSISLSKESILAFCAILGAIFGTLIALNNYPFRGRLRILLVLFIIAILYILTVAVKT